MPPDPPKSLYLHCQSPPPRKILATRLLNHIKFVCPKMLSVVCFSHTLDNVGNHFKVPDLLSFGSLWIRLFKHSHRAKLIWQELTGRTQKSYSETRWWSKWEVFEQLLVQFGDVEQFLQEAEAAKLAPQIVPPIRETLSDQAEPNQPPVTTSSHC